MKIKYNQEVDILTIQLSDTKIYESDEPNLGLFWIVIA